MIQSNHFIFYVYQMTQRLTLTGIMAVTDDFNRLRLMVLEKTPDGRNDQSFNTLKRAITTEKKPYEVATRPDLDDVLCVVTFSTPKRNLQHWLTTAASLRGKPVKIECRTRRYNFTAPNGDVKNGTSLDVVDLLQQPVN